jgi:outer membrane protein TolC
MATQPAIASGISPFHTTARTRPELAWMRASGLAQARLQLAVLAGNRRRALEQIDRLIGIDRQLERLARGESTPARARSSPTSPSSGWRSPARSWH